MDSGPLTIAADKIKPVLARLDSGEVLVANHLRCTDQYCALGIMCDESKQGNWQLKHKYDVPYWFFVILMDMVIIYYCRRLFLIIMGLIKIA